VQRSFLSRRSFTAEAESGRLVADLITEAKGSAHHLRRAEEILQAKIQRNRQPAGASIRSE